MIQVVVFGWVLQTWGEDEVLALVQDWKARIRVLRCKGEVKRWRFQLFVRSRSHFNRGVFVV